MTTRNRRACGYLGVLALGLSLAGCSESPSSPLDPSEPEMGLIGGTLKLVGQLLPVLDTYSEASIGPEGGTLEIPGGHSLYFPPGAVDETLTVSASRHPLKILVEFAPHGLVFPDSAQPQLTYSYEDGIVVGLLDHLLGGILNPSNLHVVYLDGRKVLDILETSVDEDSEVATANLSHFSTYALATD